LKEELEKKQEKEGKAEKKKELPFALSLCLRIFFIILT
jgi:hypothetical protein